MTGKERYHHGGLRKALLDAALDIVTAADADAAGIEALSLRAIAARAGVSHSAPAHHFPTLKHLTTQLAAIGFDRVASLMDEASAKVAECPRSRLAAACEAYAAFAQNNPQLFRLMFSTTSHNHTDETLIASMARLRAQFVQLCQKACCASRYRGPDGAVALELLVWSTVHGFAQLRESLAGTRGAAPWGDVFIRPALEELLLD